MSSNMAIPAVNIGGNIVQPTPEGKIKVTTAKGKVKVLSQDQFEKQIKKNAENIKAGKDFEIKKENKTAKVIGLVAAAAAVVAGVVYRKELGKLFGKASEKVSEAASKVADKITGKTKKSKVKDLYTGNSYWVKDGQDATRTVKNQTIAQMYSDDGIKAAQATRNKELAKMKADAQAAFKDYDADKVVDGLKSGKKAEELGLTHLERAKDPEKMTKLKDVPLTPKAQATKEALEASGIKNNAEFAAIKKYADPNTKEIPKDLPVWARDKETCQRYVNSVEASIAKKEAAITGKPVTDVEVKAETKAEPKAETKKTKKKSTKKAEANKTETSEAKPKKQPKAEAKTEETK